MQSKVLFRTPPVFVKTLLFTAGILLSMHSVVHASPESLELSKQGYTHLAAQRFQEALNSFEAAEKTDATDTQAIFFQGVALNRLANHGEALARLDRAKALGVKHPDLAFEIGWALLGLDRHKEAAEQLEQFEKEHPGRGQTSEFLGRAYLGMDDHERAQASFDEALKRDPSLGPSVRLYMAMMAEQRNQPAEVTRNLETLLNESPESPIGQVLRGHLATGIGRNRTRLQAGRPYSVSGSLGLGYNSNVLFEGNNGSEEGSLFTRATFDADYTWRRDNGNAITAGYSFLGNLYFNESDGNLLDHFIFGTYRHNFNERWSGSFRLSDNLTFLGGDVFRNQIALRPALGYRHDNNNWTELAYSLAFDSFNEDDDIISEQERDATVHTLSLSHYFGVPSWDVQGRAGLFVLKNDADGEDYEYGGVGFFVGLRRSLGSKWVADAFFSKSWNDYKNDNSLTGFTRERKDRPDYFALQLQRPVSREVDLYIRYTYNRANSNINFFDYNQHTIAVGVNKTF